MISLSLSLSPSLLPLPLSHGHAHCPPLASKETTLAPPGAPVAPRAFHSKGSRRRLGSCFMQKCQQQSGVPLAEVQFKASRKISKKFKEQSVQEHLLTGQTLCQFNKGVGLQPEWTIFQKFIYVYKMSVGALCNHHLCTKKQ